LRFQVAGPTHLLASGIEKRIPSGHLLERLRPARRGGTRLALAVNGRENPIKHSIDGSWCEQPKVSDRMLVMLAELSPVLRKAEKRLGREINLTNYSLDEFHKKPAQSDHFLTTVLKDGLRFVKSEKRDLDAITREQ
jgi:hypothetical protein